MTRTYRTSAIISIAAHTDTPDYLAGIDHCKLDFTDKACRVIGGQ